VYRYPCGRPLRGQGRREGPGAPRQGSDVGTMRPAEKRDFARLYDEEVWHVYAFFGYRVATRAEAEDLTQLTFERALRASDRYDERRGSPRTWLMAIARNLLIDHYRQRRSREVSLLDGEGLRREVEARQDHGRDLGLSADLADALATLTPREREILALRFGGDLNGPGIAKLTGLSLSNVQQILSRSLRRLREELDPSLAAAG
jgi:RNA polymerase sigma factor (sigma-70 family)